MKIRYQPGLDGLRGVAILSVMGFHFLRPLVPGGSLGVDIFFVLSGYLITAILLHEIDVTGAIDYRAFLGRRARRLLPALAVLLAAYLIAAPYLLPPPLAQRAWLDVATAAFYVTNLRETFWPIDTPVAHTWSLGIEEQFYLLWPFVVLILARLPRRWAIAILLVGWLALTAARSAWAHFIGGPGSYYFTPLHATGLILGSLVAFRPAHRVQGRLCFCGLLAMVFAGTELFQPLAEIAAVLVIAAPPNVLAVAPMRFLGRISYGVYLWHIPVMWTIGIIRPPWAIATDFALSLALGAASYFLIEQWFLRSHRSHKPRRYLNLRLAPGRIQTIKFRAIIRQQH